MCSYHTVLPHCEQHEKQMARNKDIIEPSHNRDSFNVPVKLIAKQKTELSVTNTDQWPI